MVKKYWYCRNHLMNKLLLKHHPFLYWKDMFYEIIYLNYFLEEHNCLKNSILINTFQFLFLSEMAFFLFAFVFLILLLMKLIYLLNKWNKYLFLCLLFFQKQVLLLLSLFVVWGRYYIFLINNHHRSEEHTSELQSPD